jgi:N-formylglutamate amidohydrolase
MSIPYDTALVNHFRRHDRCEGIGPGGVFAYRIDFSVPFMVTAIHAGHRMRDELLPLVALDEESRRFEEDVATDWIIQGTPSSLWVFDSRAEVDLNRSEKKALPLAAEDFWGQQVFHTIPGPDLNRRSLAKHAAFYAFMASCLQVLIERHRACCVYDIHSYNISRQQQKGIAHPPTFNLGTALLDKSRWGAAIAAWLEALKTVEVPEQTVTVAENLVFEGRGELCRRLTQWDPRILVLPTEIAKIYMDEHTGRVFPEVVQALKVGLKRAVDRQSRGWPFGAI